MGLDTLLNLIEGLQEERTDDGKKADLVPDRSKIFLRMIGPEAQALMIKVGRSFDSESVASVLIVFVMVLSLSADLRGSCWPCHGLPDRH